MRKTKLLFIILLIIKTIQTHAVYKKGPNPLDFVPKQLDRIAKDLYSSLGSINKYYDKYVATIHKMIDHRLKNRKAQSAIKVENKSHAGPHSSF